VRNRAALRAEPHLRAAGKSAKCFGWNRCTMDLALIFRYLLKTGGALMIPGDPLRKIRVAFRQARRISDSLEQLVNR
jgi:hypothetical protein